MKSIQNVWLPDEEEEIAKFLNAAQIDGVGVYQYNKLKAALAHVKRFVVAVDVGAHCGLWSMQLCKRFKTVHAFEPVERHRECLSMNAPTALIYPYALGDKDGTVRLAKGVKSTGDTHISPDGEYVSEVRRLDGFGFENVDFIKLDCEGYELFALRGGEVLIDRCKPTIIVEQKPGKAASFGLGDLEAVDWLVSKGYTLRGEIAGDYILSV